MAEKTPKKVEDQLNCSICKNVYTDPKLLQCLHVFCQTCLAKLVYKDEHGQLVLSCPICRQTTPAPANGAASLQPAFHINHLLDIAEDLRREKEAPASAEGEDSSSASLPPPQKEATTFCSEHVQEELKLYCETCGELICHHCTQPTGKHHNHDYELIEKNIETYKKEIGSLMEPVNQKLTSVDQILTLFDEENGEVSDQQATIEANIHDTINELHQVLDTRKTELIGRLHQLTKWKQGDLAAQKDEAKAVHAQLSSCQDFMKQSLETDRWGEALKMKTTVLKQAKKLTTTVQPDALKPNLEKNIRFSASADTTTLCRRFGKVSTPDSPDPSKCHATGKGLEVGIVGQTSTAVLQVCNREGEPCAEPVTSLECKLVSEITGTTATGSFKKLEGQNRYEISYQPTIKGRHQLLIRIQGKHIRGSPFRPAVTSSISNLGAPIHTIAEIKCPWGIAVNHNGDLVVSETDSGHISTYTPSGRNVRNIYQKGINFLGLALDREGNIIVGEDLNCIRKFSPEGKLLTTVGTYGSGRLQFSEPRDIAVNSTNNKVYIADAKNHRIQVLDTDLSFSAIIGEQGNGEGQLSHPSAVICDSAGNVYVADSDNDRIQVFTAEGRFLRMFGTHGKGEGELHFPAGIVLDPSNKYVHVSDLANHRICMFTREGEFVRAFGEDESSFNPRRLAVDSSGVLYVSNYDYHSIRIF